MDLKTHYLRLADLMEMYGPHLKPPLTKAMENGLFELRLKGHEGIARVFYCTIIGRILSCCTVLSKNRKNAPERT
jgi:phage-related protein